MEELIKITENNGKKAVNARDLHEFLESKKDFSSWIKDRIERYDFVENEDYVVLLPKVGEQTGRGGHNKIEYALSMDAAKELSMVEGNEKGKQARRYFIECEKTLKEKVLSPVDEKMKVASWVCDMLNLNGASKLAVVKSIAAPLGVPVPDYVPSKDILITMRELLEGVNISAQEANRILGTKGVLEKHSRKSSKGKIKFYWSISHKYLYLGENLVNPSNQSEVQPKWYENKKEDILSLIKAGSLL